MAEYLKAGDSIECDHAYMEARKILPGVPLKDKDIGLCTSFKCDRNSYAKIEKSVPKFKKKETSKLNVGDSIKGLALDGLVKGIQRFKTNLVGGATGRHKAQCFSSKSFTFAEITYSFLHIANALEAKKEKLLTEGKKK